jgi:hypothetical protein
MASIGLKSALIFFQVNGFRHRLKIASVDLMRLWTVPVARPVVANPEVSGTLRERLRCLVGSQASRISEMMKAMVGIILLRCHEVPNIFIETSESSLLRNRQDTEWKS